MRTIRRWAPLLLCLSGALFFISCQTSPAPDSESGIAAVPDIPPDVPDELDPEDDHQRALLEDIRSALENNNTDRALELFANVDHSDNSSLAFVHAALLVADDQIESARPVLERHTGESVRARVLLAEITEDPEERRAAFEYALEAAPDHPDALAGLGLTLLEMGEKKLAGRRFEEALEQDPESVTALQGAAEVAAVNDNPEAQIEYLKQAVSHASDAGFLHAELARALQAENRGEEAMDSIDRAIELEPDSPWHLVDRGRMHQRANRHEEAVDDFTSAIELNDSVFLFYYYRAESRFHLDSFEAALKDYERVVGARPDYRDAYAPLATLYYRFERYDEAAEYFLRSWGRVSSDLSFPMLAAISYRLAGETARAEALFRDVERNADRSSLYYDIAREFLHPRRDSRTEQRIRREGHDGMRARMQFYLGVLYETQGRRRAAEYLFLQVRDAGQTGFVETELAEVHLSRNGGGGYPE